MLVLGVILIVLGVLLGINILYVLGAVLAVIGLVLIFVRPGGRVWY